MHPGVILFDSFKKISVLNEQYIDCISSKLHFRYFVKPKCSRACPAMNNLHFLLEISANRTDRKSLFHLGIMWGCTCWWFPQHCEDKSWAYIKSYVSSNDSEYDLRQWRRVGLNKQTAVALCGQGLLEACHSALCSATFSVGSPCAVMAVRRQYLIPVSGSGWARYSFVCGSKEVIWKSVPSKIQASWAARKIKTIRALWRYAVNFLL